MITWLVVSFVLMLCALIYCARKTVIDLRGTTPASGVWGVFALAGIISTLALFVAATLVGLSGV